MHIQPTQWPEPEIPEPGPEELELMNFNGIAQATDGCEVEPDGVCPHGHPSWLLVLGMI